MSLLRFFLGGLGCLLSALLRLFLRRFLALSLGALGILGKAVGDRVRRISCGIGRSRKRAQNDCGGESTG